MTIKSNYFCGNKVSEYGIEHNRVDYRTLAKAFDGVADFDSDELFKIGNFEPYNSNDSYYEDSEGNIYTYEEAEQEKEELENKLTELEDLEELTPEQEQEKEEIERNLEELEEPHYKDIFTWLIVSHNAVDLLEEAGEVVYYSNLLDMYLWGIDHCGTAWDYVLTNIKIEKEDNQD